MTRVEESCRSVGSETGRDGKIISRDMAFRIDETEYRVTVCTQEHYLKVLQINRNLPPDAQLPTNIFLMGDVTDPDQVCLELSQLPPDRLRGYIVTEK